MNKFYFYIFILLAFFPMVAFGHNEEELYAAIAAGDAISVKELITNQANVNTIDEHMMTPLHHAAQGNNALIVGYLLDARANVNERDERSRTALSYAAERGNVEIVRQLIERGANPNAETRGMRPLHYAAQTSNEAIVRLLLNAGADTNAINIRGETAATLARHAGHEAIAVLIDNFETNEYMNAPVINVLASSQNEIHNPSDTSNLEEEQRLELHTHLRPHMDFLRDYYDNLRQLTQHSVSLLQQNKFGNPPKNL